MEFAESVDKDKYKQVKANMANRFEEGALIIQLSDMQPWKTTDDYDLSRNSVVRAAHEGSKSGRLNKFEGDKGAVAWEWLWCH